jgi:TM2 domain-containing membrane protein YozV
MAKKIKKKIVKKKSAGKKKPKSKKNPVLAISALVLNIILPGLGSIIGGNTRSGIRQLVLMAIALTTTIFFQLIVFYTIWAIAWVWALSTGIKLIKA